MIAPGSVAAGPGARRSTFWFGEEGFPEIYSRESPGEAGTVRSKYQDVMSRIRLAVTEAERRGEDLAIEHRGTPVARSFELRAAAQARARAVQS